jgi:integrase
MNFLTRSIRCCVTLRWRDTRLVVRQMSVRVVIVAGSCLGLPGTTIGGMRVRAFLVRLPSGARYWTVLDDDLAVVGEADAFLRDVRFGRDQSESTTRAYAGGIALFLRWCARTGRHWHDGVGQFGLFITWLRHAGPQVSGLEVVPGAEVLTGPGHAPARSERRVNGVLTAVRGLVVHAVASGTAPAGLVSLLYEVADHRDLPEVARGEDGRMAWRLRARHRLREPERRVDRASDEETLGMLRGCRSARDRLIVLLMARAGLRRGEVCGLRRSDVHLLADSRPLGCEIARAHLHVVRREDNPNGAWAKSRRQRAVPLDFLVVLAFDTYALERMTISRAAGSDFVLVNLFRGPVGAPMRPRTIGDLLAAASRRAGLATAVTPHQLRHAFGSSAADAGCGIDVVADLLGHASVSSSQVYVHPDPGRLRAAVDAVPSPREQAGVTR